MFLLITCLGVAGAATVETHGYMKLARGDVPTHHGPGVGAAVGWDLRPRLALEALAGVGRDGAGYTDAALRPELRWYVAQHAGDERALSVLGGVGVVLNDPEPLQFALGVGLDTPARTRIQGRFQARYLYHSAGPTGAQLTVGVRWRPPPAPEPVVVEPEPEPIDVADVVWMPEPVCDWIPPEQVELFESLYGVSAVIEPEPGESPVEGEPGEETPGDPPEEIPGEEIPGEETPPQEIPAADPVPQGALVVSGRWGDKVRIGDYEVELGEDGVVVLNAPEGPTEIVVEGGGRAETLYVAISEGYATWIRVPPPDPHFVRFGLDSSVLSPEGRQHILDFAETAGGYVLVLQGAYSPEGTVEYNNQLAQRRAEAVSAALSEAGIDPSVIDYRPPGTPLEGIDPEAQRGCWIYPLTPVESQ